MTITDRTDSAPRITMTAASLPATHPVNTDRPWAGFPLAAAAWTAR